MGPVMRRWSVRVALAAASVAGVVVGTRAVARHYLFPAREVPAAPSPEGFVVHALTAKDGVAVRALELASSRPGARTIVHFHNNRETAESRADLARALHARGLGVVLVEYRGYGRSAGAVGGVAEPTEDGLYADAECVLDMLAARGVGPERVVLWGTSLGTGVAAEMARRSRGSALVLVTPYTSIPDLVTDRAPVVPARVLVADHFDTLAKAAAIHVPTLVIHGDDDEIVPFWMGARLASAIHGARLLVVAGGRHGDLFARDAERLTSAIAAFGS